jgi:integrin alpha FG-GAP repeat containing protein 1
LVKNRYFSLNVTSNAYHSVLSEYQSAKYAIFTDMIENSMLDIIVVSESGLEISAIYNNLMGDSFFIKSRMLTDDKIGSPIRSASFRAVLTSLNDEKFVVQGSDTGQSAYGALQIPNIMIGVGRSNNFVEMFTVSTYEKGTRSQREWSPIIPKSVLYVYSNMEKDPLQWQLSLLVNPTSKINLILVVDAMLLLIIGLVIIVLYF